MKRLTIILLVLISLVLITQGCSETKKPVVTIETSFGKMIFELYPDSAPVHVDSFLARTDDGFYDSLLFFRVIKNFMIQSGDPNNNGTGGAGYNLDAEFNGRPHVEGTLSMARGYQENSAGTQFFVCLARNPKTEYLDGKYTVFGQLLKGFDVLQQIGAVPVEAQSHGEVSRPVEPVYMIKAYRSDIDGNPL